MVDMSQLDKFNLDDYVKDVFIGFYQELFRQNSTEFRWDPDKSVSRIDIADQFSADDANPESRPVIYLRRRPISFMNTSIDQLIRADLQTGTSTHTDLLVGTLEAVCVSSVELEACRLAGIVFAMTNAFQHEIAARSGMFKIDVKALGEATPLSASTTVKLVEVPVVIQVMFSVNWMLSQIDDDPVKYNGSIIARQVNAEEYGIHLKDKCKNPDGTSGFDNGDGTVCVPITQVP